MAESLNGIRATVQKILEIVYKKYKFSKILFRPLGFCAFTKCVARGILQLSLFRDPSFLF